MTQLLRIVATFCFTLLVILESKEVYRIKRQDISFGGSKTGGSCTNPDGLPGTCIDLQKCGPYVPRANRLTPDNVRFLQQAVCGYEGFEPVVCCPSQDLPLTTPEPAPVPTTTTTTSTTTTTTTPQPPPPDPITKSAALTEECGIGGHTILKVVGGSDAALGDWPWAAAFFTIDQSGSLSFSCGGALISKDYVLSAAHCFVEKSGIHVAKESFMVRVGDLDLENDADGAEIVERRIAELKPHEKFNPNNFHNDIALVKLDAPVQFSKLLHPICLPTAESVTKTFTGTNVLLIGWGTVAFDKAMSNMLQYLMIPVQPQNVCVNSYRRFQQSHPIIPTQMCAGVMEGGKDACRGDSGGPLMWTDTSRDGEPWMIIGIVSFGFNCAQPRFPGVYTRVTSYIDWINENTV